MSREILFKAKRKDWKKLPQAEWWVEGLLSYDMNGKLEEMEVYRGFCDCATFEIVPETICRYTGLTNRNSKKIWENDITRLLLPDGEVRYFKVSIKSVVRKVITHPDFDDITAKVEITGVIFEWNGYELFPCIGTYGVPDYEMMEVVGNIFDNPELLEGSIL